MARIVNPRHYVDCKPTRLGINPLIRNALLAFFMLYFLYLKHVASAELYFVRLYNWARMFCLESCRFWFVFFLNSNAIFMNVEKYLLCMLFVFLSFISRIHFLWIAPHDHSPTPFFNTKWCHLCLCTTDMRTLDILVDCIKRMPILLCTTAAYGDVLPVACEM